MSSNPCPDWATALCAGFSQIFLQRHPLCGVLCLLAILVSAPTLLGGALLGGIAGLLTAQRRDYPKAERQAGLYSYNGILLGLLLSHQLEWSALLPLLIIASAGLSTMLVHQWLKRATLGQSLLAYTAPFVGIGWILLHLTNPPAPALEHTQAVNGLTLVPGLLKGIAQVMLLPHPLAGLLIVIGLWLSSWRAALWAITGSLAGMLFGLYQQDTAAALDGLAGYNPALAALALSQQPRRPWLPVAGIIVTLLITPGFIALGLPPLTAPFILGCWLVHASVRILRPAQEQCRLRIER
ncbi:urea transporter [Pseudomonas bubulae]|uniref:urea transporter n=1 Tax=Pseudomonas bubulae TaxID=2316085 RepID=UPI001F46A110|nr:urea transporter [Pseudomonas bubulae]MCF3193613.1 urea transporter [Pseudomonas bubulae]